MIWIYILVTIVGVLLLGGFITLVAHLLRGPAEEERTELRGVSNSDLTHMDNEKLILLALCQLLEVQTDDWELADELRYRATGKRQLEGETP